MEAMKILGTKYNQQNSGNILKEHPEIRDKPHKCDKSIMGAYRSEAMKKSAKSFLLIC